VEDVAARLGRQIRLTVSGEQVELDRVVWEKLADPLMHLIRNAVHHGIESPEERLAYGKEAVATISLSGRREGDQVVIRFADDGKGLDFAAIRDKAGCYDSSLCPHAMDEQQLVDLIFAPGFSIRTVSEMSGRGVGLDVVRQNVRDLQGTVSVATSRRAGTTFIIKVPLTVGVVRALIVESGGALWAFALSDISEVRRVDGTNISWEERTIRLGTATLPWYSLPTLLGQVEDPVEVPRPLVLVFSSAGRSVVVSVPRLVGRQEIVVRGLSSQLGAVPGVVGTAVLGDGTVVPVLDPADLVRAARLRADEEAPEVLIDISRPLTVLVVDDSLSIRMLVSRLVAARGWRPLEARDGVEAVRQLAEVWPDCIVLDLEMPRMNGFEFLARLAAMPSRRNIPVIMITSRIGRQEREQATRLGVRAFLVKPWRDEELLATICQVTGIVGAGVEGS
jgi:chemosensory pili system protein ChpA (sensor histidine kinase/response regulator)